MKDVCLSAKCRNGGLLGKVDAADAAAEEMRE